MQALEGKWIVRDVDAIEMLGYIPDFIHADDPRPAKEQFNERYAHGGGWASFTGFVLDRKDETHFRLIYPGEGINSETYMPIGIYFLRNEAVIVFEQAWVVILQEDGSWECARMD